jgi:hypothetical protein
MKIALWKSILLGMALGVVFAAGAFAEGTIGFFSFCLLTGALAEGVRFSCAQMERCEAEALAPAKAAAIQSSAEAAAVRVPAKSATVRRPAAKASRRTAKASGPRSLRVA